GGSRGGGKAQAADGGGSLGVAVDKARHRAGEDGIGRAKGPARGIGQIGQGRRGHGQHAVLRDDRVTVDGTVAYGDGIGAGIGGGGRTGADRLGRGTED